MDSKYRKTLAVRVLFPDLYEKYLLEELKGCVEVLDLGCGFPSRLQEVKNSSIEKVGLDIYKPYLLSSKSKMTHNDYILADVRVLPFVARSFDCVVCFDLIEHLSKDEGVLLMECMEKIARKKVIILTPNAYVPQETRDQNPYQAHKSGWIVDDFSRKGYRVTGLGGLKFLKSERGYPRGRPKLLFAALTNLTQKAVRTRPNAAFHLLCVKYLVH